MAFRKKHEAIFKLKPDLLILQECESIKKLSEEIDSQLYNDIYWYGDNPHKGVVVINFTKDTLKFDTEHNEDFKYIIPFSLGDINLFAVWAKPDKIKSKSYVGQIWQAINYYSFLENKKYILLGDFNSHVQWDHERKGGNHSSVVNFLANKSIVSLYHHLNHINPGEEKLATQFMYRHKDKPYHLDYCFASQNMIYEKTTIDIGNYEDWKVWSDHMPLIIDNID